MSIHEIALDKDEAIRVAMRELEDAHSKWLVKAQDPNPNVPQWERNFARERAKSCQKALLYFRNN